MLVDIFGIYGACFVAWLFQDSVSSYLRMVLDIKNILNPTVTFFILWVASYGVIYVVGHFVTSLFKLSGISLLLRILGAIFNGTKGLLIVIVILTLLSGVQDSLYEQTKFSKMMTAVGSSLMDRYKDGINDDVLQPIKETIDHRDVLLDDHFQYNILEQ